MEFFVYHVFLYIRAVFVVDVVAVYSHKLHHHIFLTILTLPFPIFPNLSSFLPVSCSPVLLSSLLPSPLPPYPPLLPSLRPPQTNQVLTNYNFPTSVDASAILLTFLAIWVSRPERCLIPDGAVGAG